MAVLDYIQKIVENMPPPLEIVLAQVISLSPLRLSIKGDSKRQPSGTAVIVSKNLTNYSTTVVIDGYNRTMIVNNALKLNEQVICISFDKGNRYLVIDRVVG